VCVYYTISYLQSLQQQHQGQPLSEYHPEDTEQYQYNNQSVNSGVKYLSKNT
jgi:hypothetical protein